MGLSARVVFLDGLSTLRIMKLRVADLPVTHPWDEDVYLPTFGWLILNGKKYWKISSDSQSFFVLCCCLRAPGDAGEPRTRKLSSTCGPLYLVVELLTTEISTFVFVLFWWCFLMYVVCLVTKAVFLVLFHGSIYEDMVTEPWDVQWCWSTALNTYSMFDDHWISLECMYHKVNHIVSMYYYILCILFEKTDHKLQLQKHTFFWNSFFGCSSFHLQLLAVHLILRLGYWY